MISPVLQVDTVIASSLAEYGIVGVVLLAVGYYAWNLTATQKKYAEEWRQEASTSSKAVIELSTRQIAIQEKQSELQQTQNAQTKEYYDNMNRRMDEMPAKVAEKIKLDKL